MQHWLNRSHILIGALLLALSGSVAAPVASRAADAPALIDTHFDLTRLDGREVTEADYRGKWLIVYFGYTFCPDVCPTTLGQIGAALDSMGSKADSLQPIFITLDPARDSQKVMTDYLKAFGPRFIGLRGSGADIAETAQRFHAYYRLRGIGNGQYTVDHSSYIYVIDPQGKFVELLTADVPGHTLADSLRKLIH
jgi:protein SCO1/2